MLGVLYLTFIASALPQVDARDVPSHEASPGGESTSSVARQGQRERRRPRLTLPKTTLAQCLTIRKPRSVPGFLQQTSILLLDTIDRQRALLTELTRAYTEIRRVFRDRDNIDETALYNQFMAFMRA